MLNKASIIGNLGNDPDMRYTQSDTAVCNISVATTERWKNKDGERVEETEWHRVVAFGKLAEIMGEYLRKGSQVYIEGKIKTEKYTDKEGIERYSTKIYANEMKMLGGRRDEGGQSEGFQPSEGRSQSRSSGSSRSGGGGTRRAPPPSNDFDDDDIPF